MPKGFTSTHVASMSPRYGSFRLCACDGSNENCRYCFGTGRVSTHFEKANTGSSVRRGRPKRKNSDQESIFLPLIASDRDLRKSKKTGSQQKRNPVDPDWVLCPKCLVNVRKY